MLTAHLFGKDAREREDGGFHGMPDTVAALLAACGPSGLTLPALQSTDPYAPQVPIDPTTGEWDHHEVSRFVAVQRDLSDLAEIGILERDGEHYTGSAAVMVALVALIRDQGTTDSEPGTEQA